MTLLLWGCLGEPKPNGGWPIDTAPDDTGPDDTAPTDSADPTDDTAPTDTQLPAEDLFRGTWSLYAADVALTGEDDTHLGSRLEAADLDGDGADELLVSATRADGCGTDCGAVWAFSEVGSASTLDQADLALTAVAADHHLGGRVEVVGDLTGDGLPELAVGAIFANAGASFGAASQSGAVYLIDGTTTGSGTASVGFATLAGVETEQWLRSAAGGDFDGDGDVELVVGAHGTGTAQGSVHLFDATPSGVTSLDDADLSLGGNSLLARAGWSLAAGDADGDGLDDLLNGGTEHTLSEATKAGGAWLLRGPLDRASLDEADAELAADTELEFAGLEVAIVQDLDGDGTAELLVGSPQYGDAAEGGVYVLSGAFTGQSGLPAAASAVVSGEPGDRVGVSFDAADFDGDGIGDLVLGADGNDHAGRDAGKAVLVLGPFAGATTLDAATATWWGERSSDEAGNHLTAGDFDGDGTWDLAIGAHGSSTGAAYVLLGGAR